MALRLRLRTARLRGARLGAGAAALSTDAAQALRKLLGERRAVKAFAPDAVPDEALAEILRLTQRAPSGFNMQPYACVVVREQADRERIADAMLASNATKVKQAPVVAVFAADLEPSRRVPHIQQLMHENGEPAAAISNLPHYVRLFGGEGHLGGAIRSCISTLMSPLQAVPTNVPTIAWSFKQTAFAASSFLIAAQAHGLATCPMEGFDEIRLKHALDIPDRYAIPVVICLGYPQETAAQTKESKRLPPEAVFFDGKFGNSSAKIFSDKK